MRTSMAYFLGAGTVIAAIVVGLGGGLLIANIVHPAATKQGTETSLMERRTAPAPIQAATATAPIQSTNAASEPVPYLVPQSTTPAAAAAAPVKSGPAAETTKVTASAAPVAPSATPPSTSAAQEPAVTPDDTLAKAREAEVRRDADARPAVDKRKVERRRQWAERRRSPRRPEQELDAVEQSVRAETEPRREFAVEPAKIEMPRIRLFDPE